MAGPCARVPPLTLQSSVLGDGFSFSLEALGGKAVDRFRHV